MVEVEQLHVLLAFVLIEEGGLTRMRAASIAAQFADLDEFLSIDLEKLRVIPSISGKRKFVLADQDLAAVDRVRASGVLDPKKSPSENYLEAVGRSFTSRQLRLVSSLNLDRLSPNPFLVETLNLRTPEELVKLNVYMSATRSVVTSMGFFVQALLTGSSESVDKGEDGWDIVKLVNGKKHWIQVKSGPNDMDRDQIVGWAEKIKRKVAQGEGAYIGMTYGKRTSSTITLNLLKQLVPDWQMRTLIGRELWQFVSDDERYVDELFQCLRTAAVAVLHGHTLEEEIEQSIELITAEFKAKYGDGEAGVNKYLAEVF